MIQKKDWYPFKNDGEGPIIERMLHKNRARLLRSQESKEAFCLTPSDEEGPFLHLGFGI